jgi:hypothetical protein
MSASKQVSEQSLREHISHTERMNASTMMGNRHVCLRAIHCGCRGRGGVQSGYQSNSTSSMHSHVEPTIRPTPVETNTTTTCGVDSMAHTRRPLVTSFTYVSPSPAPARAFTQHFSDPTHSPLTHSLILLHSECKRPLPQGLADTRTPYNIKTAEGDGRQGQTRGVHSLSSKGFTHDHHTSTKHKNTKNTKIQHLARAWPTTQHYMATK